MITNIHRITSPGCGGVLHSDYGIIKSPNFPQNFPANVECSWNIIAHEGNHLEMSYDSHFQIPDSSGSCLNSYVKVHSQKSEKPKHPLKASRPELQTPAGLKILCVCLFCSRCGLVTANIQTICCQQAAARPSRVLLLLRITSSAAGFRAAKLLVQDSWRILAPVRTSPQEHMRMQKIPTVPEKYLLILMQFVRQAVAQTSLPPAAAWFLQTIPPTTLTSPTATTPSVLYRLCSSSRSKPLRLKVHSIVSNTPAKMPIHTTSQ